MTRKKYTIRIIATIALINLLSGIGFLLLYDFFSLTQFTALKWLVFSLFIVLFTQVSYGASVALLGFWVWLRGGDSHRITRTLGNQDVDLTGVSVAVVMPIYGEDIEEVCIRIETVYNSLNNEKNFENYDIFILSDTRDLDKWVMEEEAYLRLCQRLSAFGKIFYRRRKLNLNKKSGNIADFCRRWGNKYKYMIVLDADSLMTGQALVQMTRLMEIHPSAGIIQSNPKLIRAKTVFQKVMQFGSIVHGELFAKGANYWQQNSSSFWGHNAIIRLKPFMQYCGLPLLPRFGAIGGKILSHDTIEAALLRKEGFSIWSVYDLEGSYEETPPTLLDSLKRDERWCQGNLQHFWFLFAKGLTKTSRIHILLGIMSYLSSFFWLLFLIGTVLLYVEDIQFFRLSMGPQEWKVFWDSIYFETALNVSLYTYGILFLPRILTLVESIPFLGFRKYSKSLGFFLISYLLEFVFSVLLAPVLMIMHTKFIVLSLLGKKNEWVTQNRSASARLSLRVSFSNFYPISVLGLVSGVYFSIYLETLFYLFMPIWISWLTAPLLAYFSSFSGEAFGLFFSEKESFFAEEVRIANRGFDQARGNFGEKFRNIPVFFWIIVDPFYNSLHALFQKYKGNFPEHKEIMVETIVQKVLLHGPEVLTTTEENLILNDARILRRLYYRFWESNVDRLDEFWKKNFKFYKSYL